MALLKLKRASDESMLCEDKIIKYVLWQMRQQLYLTFFFIGFGPRLPSDILAGIIVVYLI